MKASESSGRCGHPPRTRLGGQALRPAERGRAVEVSNRGSRPRPRTVEGRGPGAAEGVKRQVLPRNQTEGPLKLGLDPAVENT